jgi:hypothetical protein
MLAHEQIAVPAVEDKLDDVGQRDDCADEATAFT